MNEQAAIMNQQQKMMSLNPSMIMNQPMNSQPQPQPQQMFPMNLGYGLWAPRHPQFQNPNSNSGVAVKPPLPGFKKALGPRSNWKGKKVNKQNDKRRIDPQKPIITGSTSVGIPAGINVRGNSNFSGYQPPALNELQHQNLVKARKFFPKKKFNKNIGSTNMEDKNIHYYGNSRSAPFAPRNTTSFIIRAKKSGGIASLVSPSPMTPAVLPTPILSPSREVLVDMAKEEWGVDGYGSMKGLIRLRSSGHETGEEDDGGSSESDVEEHIEVERRLDHDLSRFEMIYNPNEAGGIEYHHHHHDVLESRVDDQDTHIVQLEKENMILKERLFLMERELGKLRRSIQFLENEYENASGSDDNNNNGQNCGVVEEEEEEEERNGNGYGFCSKVGMI